MNKKKKNKTTVAKEHKKNDYITKGKKTLSMKNMELKNRIEKWQKVSVSQPKHHARHVI